MVEPDDNVKELKGVGPKKAKELEKIGRGTIKKLATANPDTLPDNTAIGEKKAREIVMKARRALRGESRFQTGIELEKEQENMGTISTGSNNFDSLLKGGVGVEYLTEVYGVSSSGKTQLAFQLAVNAQLPEEDGGADNGNQVVFIDVEETFRADRIRQMAEAQGISPEEALTNIKVARTKDLSDQEEAINELKTLDLDNVALVLIDSIVGHIRAEFKGRSQYGERADRIGDMLSELQKLASQHNIAVAYTNQAGVDPGVQYGDPVYAYGGSIMQHRSSFRIRLDDRGGKGFNAELVDSPNLPQKDVYFDIFPEGIRDPDFESKMLKEEEE